jgi:hypothetical protein
MWCNVVVNFLVDVFHLHIGLFSFGVYNICMKAIRVDINEEMMSRAIERDQGQMNRLSFMKGSGNIPGFLGEEIVKVLRPDFKWVDKYSHDFEFVSPKGNLLTIDVKTKEQTVEYAPKSDWMAAVADVSGHQTCNTYIFCRVYYDKMTSTWPFGWVLGCMYKKEYLEKADSFKEGDPEGDNGYVTNAGCLCIPYGELKKFPLAKGLTPKKYMSSTLSRFRRRQ